VGLFANIVWYPQVHPTFSIFVYVNHFSPLTDVEETMLNIDFFLGLTPEKSEPHLAGSGP
jgi:hypothetical protein